MVRANDLKFYRELSMVTRNCNSSSFIQVRRANFFVQRLDRF